MAYLDDDLEGFDDEGGSLLIESDDPWTGSASDESIGPRYRPNYSRTGPTRVPRPAPARPVGGLGGATLNTPAGRAQMQFAKPVATKEAVDAAVRDLKRDITAIAETVKKVDTTVDKNTAILDKKIIALQAAAKKSAQAAQMGLLLPLLLNKPAELASITVTPTNSFGTATGAATPQTFTVNSQTFKSTDNNIGLLIAIMAMSGGGFGGGGDGGSDSNNMLFLALALSGGFGGSK